MFIGKDLRANWQKWENSITVQKCEHFKVSWKQFMI